MTSNNKQNLNKTHEEPIPTFKEVWKTLDRTTKRQEEAVKRQEEFNRDFNEKMAKMRIRNEESKKENERQINKMRGIWSNAWGDFVESLVSGCFVELVQEWIPSINQMMKNIECKKRDGRHCEIDIIAVNDDSLVATEVKSTLSVADVRDFLEKLKSFTLFFPQFKNYKVYGAVAYLKTTQNAEKFAIRQGLFVIKAAGNSGKILNERGVFEPQIIEQMHHFL